MRLNDNKCAASDWTGMIRWVGIINSNQFSISGPSSVCPNSTASYSSTFIDPSITNYQWGWGGLTYQSGQGTPYLGVYVPTGFSNGSVVLRLGNRCGITGSPAYKPVTTSYSCGYSYSATPNPASETITVSTDEDEVARKTSPRAVTIILFDESGNVLRREPMHGSKLELNVSQIKEGIYILQVVDNEEISSFRIQINH